MNRSEKIARAKVLRREGLIYKEIGERLGVSFTTIHRWLNPERTAPYKNGRAIDPARARLSDRRYDQTHKSFCSRCGGERPRGAPADTVCASCIADDVDHRARQIEEMWAKGRPMTEICAVLGWSPGHFRAEMDRLRNKGYCLPYRRKSGKKYRQQVSA